MNLRDVAALGWLIPLAGIVIALYLLRMRRRDVQVPAVFLWPQRTEEIRANSLFQKLRFSWLLVLQLLALTLIVLTLARPQFLQKGLAGKVTVVVLDASASMGATDIKPSRLEAARALVSDMVRSASPTDRLALIEAGATPRVVFPLGNDSVKQAEGLRSVRQYDSEADMGEALRLAAAIAGTTEGAKIVVLSDGVFDRVDDFSSSKATVTYRQIGTSGENVGIQALGTNEGPNGLLAYVAVTNYGVQPARTGLTVTADGKVADSATIRIGPGQTWGKTIRVRPQTKVVEAKLDSGDALSADDYAASVTDPNAHARVLLVTKGDMFLERALALDPRVTLEKAEKVPEGELQGSTGLAGYDIVVFDGVREVAVKARGVLTFGSPGPSTPVTSNGTVKSPTFVSAENDRLMEGVDFENVFIEKFQRVAPKGGGRVLAESSAGPIVVASKSNVRHVFVAFAPLDSDFPLNVSFPVFVGNALDFLIGETTADTLAVRVGQPFAVATGGTNKVSLKTPDGRSIDMAAKSDRLVVREITKVGRHVLTVGGQSKTVLATLRSALESRIEPRGNLDVGASKVAATSQLSRFEDFWRPLLLVALVVLAIEWWTYARRS